MNYPAPKDHALPGTVGSDGHSRRTSWRGGSLYDGLRDLIPIAERIKIGSYRPEPLMIARWEERPGKIREIAFPSVYDRLVGAVLLEVLEPVLDPILSDWQHGYRASRICGRKIEVNGFKGIPRGSTKIVARRLLCAVRSGRRYLWELDVVNAFPSANRAILRKLLVEDGCSERFAKIIIRLLGDRAVDPAQGNKEIEVGGVPLGNPVGPLVFGLYVSGVYKAVPSGTILPSYADNFYLATKTQEEGGSITILLKIYCREVLGLEIEVKQAWHPECGSTFNILERHVGGGWMLQEDGEGRITCRGPRDSLRRATHE
ncbi:MAG: hypothetical protein HY897_23240 [Deltaproteobacteria bacterium]|nr:hypothetical protein [Deltaproteobacteria bacterium]